MTPASWKKQGLKKGMANNGGSFMPMRLKKIVLGEGKSHVGEKGIFRHLKIELTEGHLSGDENL